MKFRVLSLVVCLAALAAFAPLRESVAAGTPKVDLEDYIGVVPMQDDSMTFVAENDEYTDTATGVTPTPKSSVVTFEQTDPNQPGSVQDLEVFLHGKRLLRGTRVENDGTDEIAFFTKTPKKLVDFQLKPNKIYKFKMGFKVFFNGQKAAKATNYGTIKFLGFEDVVTPLGAFDQCAHFERTDNIKVKAGRKNSFEVKDTIESWEALGIGTVRFIQSEVVLDNGVVSSDPNDTMPPTEYVLDHGVINGEPFGPPEPMSSGASASASSSAASSASARATATSGLSIQISLTPGDPVQIPTFNVVMPSPDAGIDLMNAGASVVTQEMVGVGAVSSGALVGTRAGASGGVTYVPGVAFSGGAVAP